MPKVRNISPLGDLFVPSLGVTVPSGAVLALDDDQQDVADALASQSEAWVEVVSRTRTTTETAPEPTPVDPNAEEPVSPDNPDSGVEDPTPVDVSTPTDDSAPAEPTA